MKSTDNVISVEGLNKSFGDVNAVLNLNLELRTGEICGFLGPNGGGKTTSLRMLCGLLIPDSGEGTCLGYDIIHESQNIKKDIGYMPQRFSLYSNLTVYENLDFIGRLYDLKNRKARIDEVMDLFEMRLSKNKLAKYLSGGMKQRLALGSCLLHNPKILLLDEPTGGVDSRARRDFWDQLFLLSERGITTLVSTHYMDEAERCTHLIYIQKTLLAQGSVTDILKQSGIVTWRVTGEDLIKLSRDIKEKPGVEEVAFFGHELHVSGRNATLLEQGIASIPNYTFEKISPSLEDALMSFMKK